jgi:hypothetical protein
MHGMENFKTVEVWLKMGVDWKCEDSVVIQRWMARDMTLVRTGEGSGRGLPNDIFPANVWKAWGNPRRYVDRIVRVQAKIRNVPLPNASNKRYGLRDTWPQGDKRYRSSLWRAKPTYLLNFPNRHTQTHQAHFFTHEWRFSGPLERLSHRVIAIRVRTQKDYRVAPRWWNPRSQRQWKVFYCDLSHTTKQ